MGDKILGAMRRARRIHFNLEGMDMERAYGYRGGPVEPNMTNWEFQRILNDPNLLMKTRFYNMPGKE